MNLPISEQFRTSQKATVGALFGVVSKTFEGVQKLTELNLQAVQSIIAEGQETTQRVLSVKDTQELLALRSIATQPVAEKVLSYGRHVYDIAVSTQAEVVRLVKEQYAEQNGAVQALVDNVVKHAPAGSETVVGALKSAFAVATNAYESVERVTKQATDLAESNFNTAADAATKAAQDAASQAQRASKKEKAVA
jgi:phasin family protein